MGALATLLTDPAALFYLLQVKVGSIPPCVLCCCSDACSACQRWDSDAKRLPNDKALAFCYGLLLPGHLRASSSHNSCSWADVLNRVSRSFAIVIQQLGPELRDAVRAFVSGRPPASHMLQVCVFYLVLRGLDTVEDDMSIPDVRSASRLACPASRGRTGREAAGAPCVS